MRGRGGGRVTPRLGHMELAVCACAAAGAALVHRDEGFFFCVVVANQPASPYIMTTPLELLLNGETYGLSDFLCKPFVGFKPTWMILFFASSVRCNLTKCNKC